MVVIVLHHNCLKPLIIAYDFYPCVLSSEGFDRAAAVAAAAATAAKSRTVYTFMSTKLKQTLVLFISAEILKYCATIYIYLENFK